jgi:hypothetical protein
VELRLIYINRRMVPAHGGPATMASRNLRSLAVRLDNLGSRPASPRLQPLNPIPPMIASWSQCVGSGNERVEFRSA